MRASLVAAALLLATAGCSPFGSADEGANESAGPDREAGEAALVQVARAGNGRCSARWDGRPIADGAVQDHAFRTLDTIVQEAGGPQGITELPRVVLEVPQDAPYDCFARPLDGLASAGFAEIALRVAERGSGGDAIMRLPVPGASAPQRPFAVVDLRAGGIVLVDGQAVVPAMLRARLVEAPVAPENLGMTDGSLLVHPEPGATFGSLHELVGLVMEAQREVLVRPRGETAGVTPAENSQSPAR
jgi:hypothetical protein